MIDREEAIAAFGRLQGRWGEIKRQYAAEERKEPRRFNPLKYLRTDEYGISAILAGLLNPAGEHGQGAIFLDAFTRTIGVNFEGTRGARVETESRTYNLLQRSDRRIDIVVQTDQWYIGIENKPWAGDQDGQIQDYLNELHKRARGATYVLVYLSAYDDGRPAENSISPDARDKALADRILRLASYKTDIRKWLDECAKNCQSCEVKQFLVFFQRFLQENVGDVLKLENRVIVDTVFEPENERNLPVIIELIQARDTIRKKLLDRLMRDLECALPEWTSYGRPPSPRELALGMEPPGKPGWHFRVEPDKGRWFYGLKRNVRPEGQEDPLGRLELEGKQWGDPPAPWWPIWSWFDDGRRPPRKAGYSDWESSGEAWLDMSDGKMAEHLAQLAKELREVAARVGCAGPVTT